MLKLFRYIAAFKRKSLAAALLFILAAWLLFFLAVPPFENPDEDGNYAYVQSLATGNYPVLTHGETPDKAISEIGAELRSAYDFNQTRFKQDRIFDAQPGAVDETKSDYVETSIQAYHPPVYFATAAMFYWCARTAGLSSLAVFYVTKFTSLFFYLVFVANLWLFLRTMLARREAGYLTLAVAIQPSLLMMATSINPEIGAVAFFTVIFFLLTLALRNGSINSGLAGFLGVLSALAVLTKFTNIILLPLALAGIAFCLQCSWKRKIHLGAVYLVTAAVLVSPWLAFNQNHYGTLLPHNLMIFSILNAPMSGAVLSAQTGPFFVLFATFLDFKDSLLGIPGVFGWVDAPIFVELRLLYAFILVLFVSLGAWQLVSHGKRRLSQKPEHFLAAVAVMLLVAFLISYSAMMKIKYQWLPGLQGHYYLVGLLPATILFYAGIKKAFRIKHDEILARNLFYISFMVLLVGILYSILPRFYV